MQLSLTTLNRHSDGSVFACTWRSPRAIVFWNDVMGELPDYCAAELREARAKVAEQRRRSVTATSAFGAHGGLVNNNAGP